MNTLSTAQAAPPTKTPIELTVSPTSAFNLRGVGFGTHGTLRISGEVIATTGWRDDCIKGDKWPTVPKGTPVTIEGHDILGPERTTTQRIQSYTVGTDI